MKATIVSLFRNPHSWIVFALLTSITFAYYEMILPYSRQFPYLDFICIVELNEHANGSLYIVPLLYAAMAFSWPGVIVVWSLSMAVALPRLLYLTFTNGATMTNIVVALLPMVIIVTTQLEIRRRRNDKLSWEQREKERLAYVNQIFMAEDKERTRIARELHDDTMQTLAVTASYAHSLSLSDSSVKKTDLQQITTSLFGAVENLRRLTSNLRPSILDNLGLLPALRWLIDCLKQDTGIETDIFIIGEPRRLNTDYEDNIFRIVQEALNNVRKHSGATKVSLTETFSPESLQITVHDNGKGFVLPKKLGRYSLESKIGLIGMQQRARFIGSHVSIITRPGAGTTIIIDLKC